MFLIHSWATNAQRNELRSHRSFCFPGSHRSWSKASGSHLRSATFGNLANITYLRMFSKDSKNIGKNPIPTNEKGNFFQLIWLYTWTETHTLEWIFLIIELIFWIYQNWLQHQTSERSHRWREEGSECRASSCEDILAFDSLRRFDEICPGYSAIRSTSAVNANDWLYSRSSRWLMERDSLRSAHVCRCFTANNRLVYLLP